MIKLLAMNFVLNQHTPVHESYLMNKKGRRITWRCIAQYRNLFFFDDDDAVRSFSLLCCGCGLYYPVARKCICSCVRKKILMPLCSGQTMLKIFKNVHPIDIQARRRCDLLRWVQHIFSYMTSLWNCVWFICSLMWTWGHTCTWCSVGCNDLLHVALNTRRDIIVTVTFF